MSTRLPNCGLLLLFLVLIAACERAELSIAAPGPLPPMSAVHGSLAAEPQMIHPEFLPGASCVTRPPFGARVLVVLGGGDDLIVRDLRFFFNDRFGGHVRPEVISIPSLSPAIPAPSLPTSPPIPFPGVAALPGVSPIPIPGSSPVQGLFIGAGAARRLPFYLRFGCGAAAEGILVISLDAGDRSGRFSVSELRVRIAP